MKNLTGRRTFRAMLAAAAVVFACAAACAQEADVTLIGVKGRVETRLPGAAEWNEAATGNYVSEGTEVRTGSGSSASLLWPQGHVVKMSPLSSAVVSESALGGGFENTTLYVGEGRCMAIVQKLRGSSSKFDVRTPTAVAGVRGTKFLVNVDGDRSDFVVLEGELNIQFEGIEMILEESFQTSVLSGSDSAAPEAIPSSVRESLGREADSVEKSADKYKEGTSDSETQKTTNNFAEDFADEEFQSDLIIDSYIMEEGTGGLEVNIK